MKVFFYIQKFFPSGPTLISKFRPDLRKKYEGIFGEDDTRVMEYIYHCNAQSPRYLSLAFINHSPEV